MNRRCLIFSPLTVLLGVVMGLAIGGGGGAAIVGAAVGTAAMLLIVGVTGRSRLAKFRSRHESASAHVTDQPESPTVT
jgi:uncharacterized membrane protein YdjX (TVP38/TMEM64 family)